MFTSSSAMLGQRISNQDQVEAARFEDPLARQIQWCPISAGGANFCTYRLAPIGVGRLEFRATIGARIFYAIFLISGMAVAIGFPILLCTKNDIHYWGWSLLLPVIVGLIFVAIGGGMLYSSSIPIVFDKSRGFYWQGHKAPYALPNPGSHKHAARLEDIHALQLISEYCSGKKTSYYSYELNLVLKNGQRLNVIDHGNLEKIRADTSALARFLGKPVWDAI